MSIVFESNVPIPVGLVSVESQQWFLRSAMAQMLVGESFIFDRSCVQPVYRAAKMLKIRIITRKLLKGGFRVWRKS